jgi:hypothetical protein
VHVADRKISKRKQNIYVVLAVLGVVGVLAGFSRLPSPPPGEVSRLAGHFKLDWQNLPPAPMPPGGVVFSFGLPSPGLIIEIGTWLMRTESELVLKSRRVVPGRLLDTGFHFLFPEWPAAARDLIARMKA